MAKPQRPIPADLLAGPVTRAQELAEKMALLLNHEDYTDGSIAIALVTSSLVYQYADDLAKAGELLAGIRRLEDRLVAKALGVKELKLQ